MLEAKTTMKVFFLIGFLLVGLGVYTFSGGAGGKLNDIKEDRPRGVLLLNEDNFDKTIKNNKYVLVKFFASWCGHCKNLAPEYIKAAEKLADMDSEIVLAEVNAEYEYNLSDRFKIRGYPTLKFFRNEQPIDFTGPRNADDIVAWVLKKSGPEAKVLNTVEEVKKFAAEKDVVVLGLFGDLHSEAAKEYVAAAAQNEDIPFGISSSVDVRKEFGVSEKEAVIMLKQFDDPKVVFNGDFKSDAILKFVRRESLSLVPEFNQENAHKIFDGNMKSFVFIFVGKRHNKADEIIDAARKVAKEFKGKITFVSFDTDKREMGPIIQLFNLRGSELPAMRIAYLDREDGTLPKYKPDTPALSAEAMKNFVNKYFDGELEQIYTSEEIHDDWDKEPVKVLVGKNFDSVVLDKSKDVLVKFYTPGCTYCQKLAPIYDDVAKEYEHSDSVVIAKMDATANEQPHVKISHYPTIKLFKKESNEVVDFEGTHTYEAIIDFLEEHIEGAPYQDEDFVGRDEL